MKERKNKQYKKKTTLPNRHPDFVHAEQVGECDPLAAEEFGGSSQNLASSDAIENTEGTDKGEGLVPSIDGDQDPVVEALSKPDPLHPPLTLKPQPFERDGVIVSFEYNKPDGFENLMEAQKNRITDSSLDLSLVELYGALGLTEQQIAALHGIPFHVLRKWKDKIPEFEEALNRGKDIADAEVVKKLFQRAVGYKYHETYTETREGPKGVEVIRRTTTREAPPDVQAQQLWLTNRRKDIWRAVWRIEGELKKEVIFKELATLSREELAQLAKSIN
jgi:hypothetical protein